MTTLSLKRIAVLALPMAALAMTTAVGVPIAASSSRLASPVHEAALLVPVRDGAGAASGRGGGAAAAGRMARRGDEQGATWSDAEVATRAITHSFLYLDTDAQVFSLLPLHGLLMVGTLNPLLSLLASSLRRLKLRPQAPAASVGAHQEHPEYS